MNESRTPPLVESYTVVLFVMAVLMVVSAVVMHAVAGESEKPATMHMIRNIEIVLAIAVFFVSWLRYTNAPSARIATAVISILFALSIPVGTALFLWWLLSIRKREASPTESDVFD